MAAELINVLLGLLAVVAAIMATGWLVRRGGGRVMSGAGDLKVLGGVAVGQRERVVLVECRGEQLLVGVAQGSVQPLHLFGPAPAADTSGQVFADALAASGDSRAAQGGAR